MEHLHRTQSIHSDEQHRELHFAIGGFWDEPEMLSFLADLASAASPFITKRTSFNAIGDLSAFVPQNRATAAAIRDSLLEAQKFGLQRFAVVTESSLVRMQYRRITDGVDVEFFDNGRDAVKWLRGQHSAPAAINS